MLPPLWRAWAEHVHDLTHLFVDGFEIREICRKFVGIPRREGDHDEPGLELKGGLRLKVRRVRTFETNSDQLELYIPYPCERTAWVDALGDDSVAENLHAMFQRDRGVDHKGPVLVGIGQTVEQR